MVCDLFGNPNMRASYVSVMGFNTVQSPGA